MSQVRGRSPRRVGDGTFREMREPIILAVHEDGDALGEVQEALLERYAKSYRVLCVSSADEARAVLSDGAGVRRSASRSSSRPNGSKGDRRAASFSTWCGRCTRVPGGHCSSSGAIGARRRLARRSSTASHGVTSTATWCVLRRRPTRCSTRRSRACSSTGRRRTESRRTRSTSSARRGRVVPSRSARRCRRAPFRTPSAWRTRPEGRELIATAGEGVALPMMLFPNGAVLGNPTNAEIADAAGAPARPGTGSGSTW